LTFRALDPRIQAQRHQIADEPDEQEQEQLHHGPRRRP
jgi:hypothetical protein